MQTRRATKRSDAGQVLLTDRDIAVLTWLGEQYGVRLDQLQLLLGRAAQRPTRVPGRISEGTARRVLRRWLKASLVESRKYLYREPAWVWLSRRGLHQLGFTFRYWQPRLVSLKHTFWVNQVRLALEQRRRGEVLWISERTLKAAHQEKHLVDAEVRLGEVTVGIEVELTRKRTSDLATILNSLAHEYATIWYFTTQETRTLVEQEIQQLPTKLQRRFRVYDVAAELA